jgi:SulP family sulfate permease
MLAAGLAVIYLVPRITSAIPSPLICILVLTVVCHWLHLPVKTVADLGKLPDSLPMFAWPSVPLTLDTLQHHRRPGTGDRHGRACWNR